MDVNNPNTRSDEKHPNHSPDCVRSGFQYDKRQRIFHQDHQQDDGEREGDDGGEHHHQLRQRVRQQEK